MLVQEPIQGAIQHCLDHYCYKTATKLAERLWAEVGSEEALYLLATTHFRAGKIGRAYTILKIDGHNSPQLKYLMAKCCYDLGKLDEAESTLTGGSVLKPKQVDDLVTEFGSLACFALEVLGNICAKTERTNKAIEALRRCLKLNPFMWSAFALLCDLGDKPDPSKVFKLDSIDNFLNIHGNTIYSLINQCENIGSNHANITDSVSANTLSNVSMNTPANENFQLSSQQNITIHSQQQQTPHLTIPNNPNIINQGPPSISIVSTPIQHCLSGLNNSINSHPLPIMTCPDTVDSFDSYGGTMKVKKCLRYRPMRMFGNPSCLSPITPNFGFVPLDLTQNSDSDISLLNSSITLLTPSPLAHIDSQTNNKIHSTMNKRILGRNISKDKPTVFAPASNNSNYQSPPTGQMHVRRSSRLFGNSNSVKENNKNRFAAPKSPARKTKTRSSKIQSSLSELNEKNKNENHDLITSSEKSLADKPCTVNLSQQAISMQKNSAEGLMSLFRDIGSAYLELSQFNCRKAIELLSALPSQHYNTGWVLSNIGKAYFEMNDYNEAIQYFSEVREKEPYSLLFMDYYSTALWHLQKEVQLSSLAQDIVDVDSESPQAWVVTGNCFSLQKEHEAAIKFFSRAIQVDPNFSYAYTLLGHEHLVTEELDRALSCYRSAVRIDSRHYNAWYGIGLVLFKQERFGQAEWYFKKAVSIHPQSAVLICHVAVVEHTLQKSTSALLTLKKALAIDPKNPLCKYHRASILHSLDNHQEALQELLELKDIVPKESNVYFLLGKVYKRLGDTHLALMNFSWAMDLDPKGANNQFKEAIDPAINCFPPEEEISTNNNPQENVTSEASSSLMAAESSQESLILEPDNNQVSGIDDHPLSTSLSASILGPSTSGITQSNPATTPSLPPSETMAINSQVSSLSFGLMTPPSSVVMPSASSSKVSTPTSSHSELISWISSSSRSSYSSSKSICRGNRRRMSPSSSTSGIQSSSSTSPTAGGVVQTPQQFGVSPSSTPTASGSSSSSSSSSSSTSGISTQSSTRYQRTSASGAGIPTESMDHIYIHEASVEQIRPRTPIDEHEIL